ncbi:MAG TPA: trypsin-like peptidase domain-containing protein [Longimicrobiales bacterium]
MDDRTLRRSPLLLFIPLAFLFGLGLASGLEWPAGTEAAPAIQATLPDQARLREAVELSEAFTAIAEAITPAVVRIEVQRIGGAGGAELPPGFRDFFRMPGGEQPPPQVAGGTGFIVSDDGYILTNNHVIEGADRITVTLVDNRKFDARVVGRDPTTDVAVIRIEAKGLPAARLGDSDRAMVGEWVLAVGNPGFGDASTLDFTVTSGIISAKGRPLQIIGSELMAHADPAASYAIEDFIQTDAVINPGNSGGPLVNLRGEVIGINTAIASGTGFYQGYGFAIPANLARRVMTDLIKYGHVRRPLLGINIVNVTAEDAEVFKLPEIAGVLVEDFSDESSPARRAGIQRGDVIIAVDDQRVERVGQLQRLIAQRQPGQTVEVRVIRYGEPHRFRVRLTQAEIPRERPRLGRRDRVDPPEQLGLEIGELTPALAREIGYAEPGGAVITGVLPTSPAAVLRIGGLRIVEIDRQPIETAREAQALLRRARSGDVVSLLLQRPDGRMRFANVRVP